MGRGSPAGLRRRNSAHRDAPRSDPASAFEPDLDPQPELHLAMQRSSTAPLSRSATIATWTAQLLAAGILGQTLFFKFTGAPEAVDLFTQLGVEPFGRVGSGLVELLAVVLLLTPRFAVYGALVALGTMGGAILAHLTVLGIEFTDRNGVGDGGSLFALALVTTLAALVIAYVRRRELPLVGSVLRRVDSMVA
jgi:hypothetical protein